MAREALPTVPERDAQPGGPPGRIAMRERWLVSMVSLQGWWQEPLPKLAADAGRKSRVPGLEVVPSCLGSLSRRDLAWVPKEGRGAPSE